MKVMIRELICYSCKCSKCNHLWTTKTHTLPQACPKCRRVTWNDDYDFRDAPAEPVKTPEPVKPLSDVAAFIAKAQAAKGITAEPIEDVPEEPTEFWIDDPITFENGEILYWHHKPKCKPVCYRRESDISGA